MALLPDLINAAHAISARAGLITTFPTFTDKSGLGNETLYISPASSPCFPMALAMSSVFSRSTSRCANAGLANTVRPSKSPATNLADFMSASLGIPPMAVQATLGRAAGRQNTIIGPAIRKVLDLAQQGWTCERTNTWLAVPKGALGS